LELGDGSLVPAPNRPRRAGLIGTELPKRGLTPMSVSASGLLWGLGFAVLACRRAPARRHASPSPFRDRLGSRPAAARFRGWRGLGFSLGCGLRPHWAPFSRRDLRALPIHAYLDRHRCLDR
jgi:hypothetical protein